MVSTPIIVGLDPGTTSAYAILNSNGEIMELDSSRDISLDEIIKRVMKIGSPVIVGTDKSKIPDLVEKFSARTGSKISSPEEDLRVEEKKLITRDFHYKDSHEMDALAGALFAYKKILRTIEKIKSFVKEQSKEAYTNELIIYVIKEGLSIRSSISLIENKDEEAKIINDVIYEKRLDKRDFLKLFDKIKRLESENKVLVKHNNEIIKKNFRLEDESKKNEMELRKKQFLKSKKIDKLFSLKEKRADELNKKIDENNKVIQELNRKIENLYRIFSELNSKYVLKKLNNLSEREYEKKKSVLKIVKGDILFVDDVNIYSEKIIEILKDTVQVIVCKNKINQRTQEVIPFQLISSQNLKIEEFEDFAIVEKDALNKLISKREILHKIIEEYKKGRG